MIEGTVGDGYCMWKTIINYNFRRTGQDIQRGMAECEIRIEEVMREGTAAERRLCGGEEGERGREGGKGTDHSL